ncbi:dnaJ protein subfamily B member 14 [Pelomyxa schiedti]|nr:dnaJ protein subfamily B member 14 [Pelomyxa schiedti]
MECNKGEAERCVEVALQAIQRGDTEKGCRFLTKSISLYPTERAKALLDKLQQQQVHEEKQQQQQQQQQQKQGETTTTNTTSTSAGATSEGTGDDNLRTSYTEEQAEEVKRILASKGDFYSILRVHREADAAEIKRAYRKLALKMHPDKNKAPKSEEAFKILAQAFACLSNPVKRDSYDINGVDPDAQPAHSHPFGGFSEEIDPDEIFRAFFADLNPSVQRTYRFYASRHREPPPPQGNSQFLVFLVVAMGLFVLFGMFGSRNQAPYSFEQSTSYPIRHTSPALHIDFFANESWDKYTVEQKTQIEVSVETQWLEYMRQQCGRSKSKCEAYKSSKNDFIKHHGDSPR